MPPSVLARSLSVLVALLVVVVASTGCSAVRMGLHWSGAGFGESYQLAVQGEGPVEERLRVVLVDAPPPVVVEEPPVVVEEPPVVVEEPPVVGQPPPPPVAIEEPLPFVAVPEPPPDPPPIAFLCTTEERFTTERVKEGVLEFGFIEKMVLGMVLAFDTIVSVVSVSSAYEGFSDGDLSDNDLGTAALATVFTADALGLLAILLFMPPTRSEHEHERPGTFRPRMQGCPSALVVERGGRRMALDNAGLLSLPDEAFLVRSLAFEGGGVDVLVGNQRSTLTPLRSQVCTWAADRGLSPPDCGDPSSGTAATATSQSVPPGTIIPLGTGSSSLR